MNFFFRFFKLFAKYKKDDKDTTPLPFLMQLLLNEKIQSSVIGNMDNLLENLLTLREDDEDEEDNEEQDVEMKAEKIPLNVMYVLDVNDEQIAKLNCKIFGFLFVSTARKKAVVDMELKTGI